MLDKLYIGEHEREKLLDVYEMAAGDGNYYSGRSVLKEKVVWNIIKIVEISRRRKGMEHYIREIYIDKLRHLSNIDIVLNPNRRQHLMITGKNGSGKTSLLIALQKYLQAICGINYDDLIGRYISKSTEIQKNLDETSPETEKLKIENDNEYITDMVKMYADDIRVAFSDCKELGTLFRQGDFITAYFPANRKTEIIRSRGVEDIKLADFYEQIT